MKLERGAHAIGLRISLTLQSEDVETHSFMTDHLEVFSAFADFVAASARLYLQNLKADGTLLVQSKVLP